MSKRGLKQGGPSLNSTYFLLMNGLSGLNTNLNLFYGFRVSSSHLKVSHLKYTDDVIILSDALVDNLWAINFIFRDFELSSGSTLQRVVSLGLI